MPIWPMVIIALLGLGAIAYDIAHSTHCQQCDRPFGVFSIRGRLRIWVRVCWRCRQAHHRRLENRVR